MNKLTLAFFGTPSFAAIVLEQLIKDNNLPIDVSLVVTQPDKPVGKKQILTPSPVKVIAQQYDIELYDDSAKDEKLADLLKQKEIDVVLLFAYGEIIRKTLLEIPRLGFWNIHPSLLPLYRGASPIVYPLLFGENKTGVSLMLMDEKLDHGPIIAQEELTIMPDEKRNKLEHKLTMLAISLFKKNIIKVAGKGTLETITDQNHTQATFTRMIYKNDGFIPLEILKAAIHGEQVEFTPQIIADYFAKNLHGEQDNIMLSCTIFNLFRAFYPWPGIWTKTIIQGTEKRIKITDIELVNDKLILKKVQLEGKNEVDIKTFQTAYNIF